MEEGRREVISRIVNVTVSLPAQLPRWIDDKSEGDLPTIEEPQYCLPCWRYLGDIRCLSHFPLNCPSLSVFLLRNSRHGNFAPSLLHLSSRLCLPAD